MSEVCSPFAYLYVIQLGTVFCVHLVFLPDKVKRTQMQNPHYAQYVSFMLEQIPIFKRSGTAGGTVL